MNVRVCSQHHTRTPQSAAMETPRLTRAHPGGSTGARRAPLLFTALHTIHLQKPILSPRTPRGSCSRRLQRAPVALLSPGPETSPASAPGPRSHRQGCGTRTICASMNFHQIHGTKRCATRCSAGRRGHACTATSTGAVTIILESTTTVWTRPIATAAWLRCAHARRRCLCEPSSARCCSNWDGRSPRQSSCSTCGHGSVVGGPTVDAH